MVDKAVLEGENQNLKIMIDDQQKKIKDLKWENEETIEALRTNQNSENHDLTQKLAEMRDEF